MCGSSYIGIQFESLCSYNIGDYADDMTNIVFLLPCLNEYFFIGTYGQIEDKE